jgi:hypothetical protein
MAGTIVAFALCAFRTLMLYGDPFPPLPPGTGYTPGPVGQVFVFVVCCLIFVSLFLLVLPKKWLDTIIEIAFHLPKINRSKGD